MKGEVKGACSSWNFEKHLDPHLEAGGQLFMRLHCNALNTQTSCNTSHRANRTECMKTQTRGVNSDLLAMDTLNEIHSP